MTFAECAMRCWHVAAQALGWRPDEFWAATPAEVMASLGPSFGVDTIAPDLMAELQSRFPD